MEVWNSWEDVSLTLYTLVNFQMHDFERARILRCFAQYFYIFRLFLARIRLQLMLAKHPSVTSGRLNGNLTATWNKQDFYDLYSAASNVYSDFFID